ncbi:unnamed protein product [Ostreobium quekettii]|uniref:Uncharacterized protein n=1 Tax=Ostreobium quekettii TaxID=121088 RepID=A0A8S1JEJ3_9CHLO|nr:unnamed protein product [Ostreobium quekettii]
MPTPPHPPMPKYMLDLQGVLCASEELEQGRWKPKVGCAGWAGVCMVLACALCVRYRLAPSFVLRWSLLGQVSFLKMELIENRRKRGAASGSAAGIEVCY